MLVAFYASGGVLEDRPIWLTKNEGIPMKTRTLTASVLLALVSLGASAQTTADTVQRDVNQQTRIENGLKDGSLNTREASRLESEQSRIDRLQAKELKDGKLSPQERAQLRRAQNHASQDIKAAESNKLRGNPESKSSERMQADVQRNVNQQQRVEQGVKSGELSNHEVGKLERGQARVDRAEAVAGADGHVGDHEQNRIQRKEDHQSGVIFRKKHNAIERKG
jgi:predicted transglutaminase-like cysteine proteinase